MEMWEIKVKEDVIGNHNLNSISQMWGVVDEDYKENIINGIVWCIQLVQFPAQALFN